MLKIYVPPNKQSGTKNPLVLIKTNDSLIFH